ncbi:hypothetical protein Alsa1_CDS0084 [Staphylococcus phage Alsa_1]|nr:hypothetical protein Alsa1_CDS0084 [Staphylococcus phage Alsa_1]
MALVKEYSFKGVKTRLRNQYRKHVNHMTTSEKDLCVHLIRQSLNDKKFKVSNHCKQRGTHVNKGQFFETVRSKDFIDCILEYNESSLQKGEWTQRVLFEIPRPTYFYCERDKCKKLGKLKVVYDVTTGHVITAYYNELSDNHTGLNESYYIPYLEIRDYKSNGYTKVNPMIYK